MLASIEIVMFLSTEAATCPSLKGAAMHASSHDSAIFSLSPEAVTFLIRKKCDNILISSRGGILNFTKVPVFSSTKDVFLKNLTKKLEKLCYVSEKFDEETRKVK